MKVAGVIAEYNPFHNGHLYQLTALKEKTNADYVVVAMSGNFLQRGVPAAFDKFSRAHMALLAGADLVLEIPTIWATASAEYYATAGVELLGTTGIVTDLGYGVETNAPEFIRELAAILNNAPQAYDQEISDFQKQGLPYPAARVAALGTLMTGYSQEQLNDYLSTPNNILALEYEKALAKHNANTAFSIASTPITRVGDDYHATEVTSAYASATAIRKVLMESSDIRRDLTQIVPAESLDLVYDLAAKSRFMDTDSISLLLHYRLLSLYETGYEDFADCSTSLSAKIKNHIHEYVSFSQFCNLLKSKDITYTRVSRVLMHILLNIRKTDYAAINDLFPVPYMRILGFRKDSSPLLSEIKSHATVPMVSKIADAKTYLSEKDYSILQKDMHAADIYRSLAIEQMRKAGQNIGALHTEFTQSPIII